MNIKVTTTKVNIEDESLNKGEYNIRECNFDLAEEFTGLVCKALFTVVKTKLTYEQSIVNGKCNIPYEATENRGKVIVGVIGYEVEDEELIKRYSPEPDEFFVLDGSYVEDIENQSTPTPSELEQLEQRVSTIEIDAEQVEINTQDISDIKQEQITQNNDILLRSLITETGSQIELSLNSTNFKMTAILKDKNGNVVNTSNEIDLPLESVVVNASYDSATKELVLTLQNGTTVRVSIADLVSGLQTEITSSNKLNADLVDDSTSTNKFVTASEKTQITTNKNNITSLNTNKEDKSNKVTSLNSSSTNTQYPSAKAVYDNIDALKGKTVTDTGSNITLSNTANLEFIQPPLPRGNSEQVQTTQSANLFDEEYYKNAIYSTDVYKYTVAKFKGDRELYVKAQLKSGGSEISGLYVGISTTPNPNDSGGIYRMAISNGYVPAYSIRDFSGYSTLYFCYFPTNISLSDIFDNYNIWVSTDDVNYVPFVPNSPSPEYLSAITNVTGDVEVLVQNKNLWDKDGTNFNGQTGVNNFNTRKIIRDSAIGNNGYELLSYNTRCLAYFKGKIGLNYYISMDSGFVITGIKEIDENGIITSTINSNNITLTQKVFAVMIRKSDSSDFTDSDADKLKDSIQIEYGTTATTYTPHKEQTFTFPLGNQRMYLGDYLADDGIHHVRKQIEITAENVNSLVGGLNTTTYSKPYITISKSLLGWKDSWTQNISILNNYSVITSTSKIDSGTYAVNFIQSYLTIFDDRFTDLATAKQLLIGTIIEIQQANEWIETYTTEQQTAYDEIKKAISYEEQTNISGVSDEAMPLFEVEAVQYKEPDIWTVAYVKTMIDKALQELSE